MEKIINNFYFQKLYVLLLTVGGNTISMKTGSLYLIFGAFAGLLFQRLKVRFDLFNVFTLPLLCDDYNNVKLVTIGFSSVVDFCVTYSGLSRTVTRLGSVFSWVRTNFYSYVGIFLPKTGNYNNWTNTHCISMLILGMGSFSIFSYYSSKLAARVICTEDASSYPGITRFCKNMHVLNIRHSFDNRTKAVLVADQKVQKYLRIKYIPNEPTKREIKILLARLKKMAEISKEISNQIKLKQNNLINIDVILQGIEKVWFFLKNINFRPILLNGMSSLFMLGCVRTDVRADFFSDLFTYDPANPTLLDQFIQIFFCSPSGLAVLFTTFKIAKAGFFSDFELDSGIISTFFVPLWIQCGQSGNYRYYLKGSNWRRLFVSALVIIDSGRLAFMFKSGWFIKWGLKLVFFFVMGCGFIVYLYYSMVGEKENRC